MDPCIQLLVENPKKSANILSKLGFIWMKNVYYKSIKDGLKLSDLYKTLECDKSKILGDALEKNWNKEVKRCKEKNREPSLAKALSDTFFLKYMLIGLALFVQFVIFRSSQPIVLSYLIRCFTKGRSDDQMEMYVFTAVLILISTIQVFLKHHVYGELLMIGMRMRIATSSLIYRKILKLNKKGLRETTSGQIVNLLSNDVHRFDFITPYLHHLWIAPCLAVVSTFLIWQVVGIASLASVTSMIFLSIPLQLYFGKKSSDIRQTIATRTDFRVRLMNEVISGIQVIKMYAWEKPFEKLVKEARRVEIKCVTTASYIRAILLSSTVFIERAALFFTVVTYVLIGNNITADKVFSMAQYFNTLQLSMAICAPLALSLGGETLVSISRLQAFLLLEEKQETLAECSGNGKQIYISKVFAHWVDTEGPVDMFHSLIKKLSLGKIDANKPSLDDNFSSGTRPTLNIVNLEIPAGSLCAIVGPVGSGKSSILQLLLGELLPKSGEISIKGEISYSSQEPWLFGATVRSNILFGQEYDEDLYQTVVEVCALKTDFDQLPYGDKTKVGERGVSLSGGQRARINLARAVYRKADIYLLDDPLSAVDTQVGKNLFDKCIGNYLAGKTRVLVTHQVQYLKKADVIIVLNNGRIEAQGTYEELTKMDLAFTKMPISNEESTVEEDSRSKLVKRISSVRSNMSTISHTSDVAIVENEEEIGLRKGNVAMEYLKAGGNWFSISSLVFILIAGQIALSSTDYWIAYWTEQDVLRHENYSKPNQIESIHQTFIFDTLLVNTSPSLDKFTYKLASNLTTLNSSTKILNISMSNSNTSLNNHDTFSVNSNTQLESSDGFLDRNLAIYIYSALIVASLIIPLMRSFLFFKLTTTASKNLHFKMFHSLLRAPMRFFDTNPSGRVLNRFSKDMGCIDEFLPRLVFEAVQISLVMGGIFVMVAISNYWMIIAMVVLGVLFMVMRKYYLHTIKEVKQIEGVTKSPIFSHVNSTMYGITTIRACKAEEALQKEFDDHQDLHTSAWFLTITCSNSFGMWLDLICTIFVAVITFSFIMLNQYSEVSSSMVGLALSQSFILIGMVQFGITQSAEAINQMTSVERVLQYTQLDKEGPFESPEDKKPTEEWPGEGNVKFVHVSLKYSQNDPPVLKDLSLDIFPGEKIGIVGRTGAGKSSLIAALFRLSTVEGEIILDGINTKEIGLTDLRRRISIIPQEPVLFSESLRFNLDPFKEYEDGVLWNALEEVELKLKIQSLDFMVNGGGANFSLGERQLVCLARAIVRKSKVLILDEATANVDPETDSLIQATIRRKFKSCTVLTIAHRLNTIMDSDRVLVLDAGRIIEFDHPHKLLQDKKGHFTKMVQQTGPVITPQLKEIARKAFQIKS